MNCPYCGEDMKKISRRKIIVIAIICFIIAYEKSYATG